MEIGIKNKLSLIVTEGLTAKAVGSGTLAVYATPSMIALMEKTAAESVELLLGDGKTSVGTKLEVEHLSATPIGMEVSCISELKEIDNRRLIFSIEAYDEVGLIGKAKHERFIVDAERFTLKTYEKPKK